MPLAFPHQDDDVRLKRSPLAEVICQIRIPPILRIPEEKPVALQEQVRRRFPDYEVEDNVLFRLDVSSGRPLPSTHQQTVNRTHKFVSQKRGSTATLAQDFFALQSTRYTVWEEFGSDLHLLSEAVNEIYEPSHATRIGLRYINLLDTEKLERPSFEEVVELLRPELTTLYRTDAWSEPSEMAVQILLEEEATRGRLGLRLGQRKENDKAAFVLDFDFFEESAEGLPLANLVNRCDRYHRVIYDAFRWCIAEGKLDVFEPVPKREASQ